MFIFTTHSSTPRWSCASKTKLHHPEGGKKAASPPPPPTPPPKDEAASQESQRSRSPSSSFSQAATSRYVSPAPHPRQPQQGSPKKPRAKTEFKLRSVDHDEEIVIAWVNENECLWNNRITVYRETKKKEALWQAKADKMQYSGKYFRNRFHFFWCSWKYEHNRSRAK